MFLTIVLRKEVPDELTGQQIFELVKTRLADHPEVGITGSINNTLPIEPEVP